MAKEKIVDQKKNGKTDLELLKGYIVRLNRAISNLEENFEVIEKKDHIGLVAAIAQAQETSLKITSWEKRLDDMLKVLADDEGKLTPIKKQIGDCITDKFKILKCQQEDGECTVPNIYPES